MGDYEQEARSLQEERLSDLVIAELEWVLESAHQVPRQRIVQAIQAPLADSRFSFEDRAS